MTFVWGPFSPQRSRVRIIMVTIVNKTFELVLKATIQQLHLCPCVVQERRVSTSPRRGLPNHRTSQWNGGIQYPSLLLTWGRLSTHRVISGTPVTGTRPVSQDGVCCCWRRRQGGRGTVFLVVMVMQVMAMVVQMMAALAVMPTSRAM